VENELTQEQMQDIWNEEANKLDAGEKPAIESQAAAPLSDELPPQDDEPQQAVGSDDAPEQAAATEPVDPLAGLPDEVKQALSKIT